MIGYGGFGRFTADAVEEMPDVRIAAVMDVSASARDAAAARHGARAYERAEDLLADREVELVVISTPPDTHAPLAIAAANAGKHIFCEKPLAMSLAEADAILAAVRAGGVRLTLNYVMRRNSLNQRVARLLATGALGPLHHMALENWATDEPLRPGHWFWDLKRSGSIWIEHGVHFFDLFAWLSGAQAEAVTAISRQRPDGARDREWAIVRYAGEAAATYHHAFTQPQRMEQTTVRLTCARGYLTLHGWIQLGLELDALVDDQGFEDIRRCLGAEPEVVERYDGATGVGWAFGGPYRVSRRVRATVELPEAKGDVYAGLIRGGLEDLIRAIRDPGHTLQVTPEDGRASLAVAVAAVESSASGRVVPVAPPLLISVRC